MEKSVAADHATTRSFPPFFVSSFENPETYYPNVILPFSEPVEGTCRGKITLPKDEICGTPFSLGGVDDLVLRDCGTGILTVYHGDTECYDCSEGYLQMPRRPVLYPVYMP